MPSIIHISDLHFGPKHVERLAELILEDTRATKPDLVVVSGDWTMRGRHAEYERARSYFQKLPPPVLTIPGNHDQPLHLRGLYERLTRPWARYKTYIHQEVDAVFRAPGLFVIGLNTSHHIVPGGIWLPGQRRWMEAELQAAPPDACKVLVMHHHLLWEGKWRPAGQLFPTRTLNRLTALGVELILNGHTHVPITRQTPQGIVIAQAGTAMSGRTRFGHGNTYNRIEITPEAIHVAVQAYDPTVDRFATRTATSFPRRVHHAERAA